MATMPRRLSMVTCPWIPVFIAYCFIAIRAQLTKIDIDSSSVFASLIVSLINTKRTSLTRSYYTRVATQHLRLSNVSAKLVRKTLFENSENGSVKKSFEASVTRVWNKK